MLLHCSPSLPSPVWLTGSGNQARTAPAARLPTCLRACLTVSPACQLSVSLSKAHHKRCPARNRLPRLRPALPAPSAALPAGSKAGGSGGCWARTPASPASCSWARCRFCPLREGRRPRRRRKRAWTRWRVCCQTASWAGRSARWALGGGPAARLAAPHAVTPCPGPRPMRACRRLACMCHRAAHAARTAAQPARRCGGACARSCLDRLCTFPQKFGSRFYRGHVDTVDREEPPLYHVT